MSHSHYVILDTSPTDEQYNASTDPLVEIGGTFVSHARRSVDTQKTVLEFNGDTPTCFEGMTIYSHAEIEPVIKTDEWTPDLGNGN